jgi:hypothetical protein
MPTGLPDSSGKPGRPQNLDHRYAAALPAATSLHIDSLQEIPLCDATDAKSMRH